MAADLGPLLWVSCATAITVLSFVWPSSAVIDGLGINWGTQMTHPLAPETMVQVLKDNGFTKVKLFDAEPWTVGALSGSGIEVVVGIPNDMLRSLASDHGLAEQWVKENVTNFIKDNINIKYVAVGNEPYLRAFKGMFTHSTLAALKNVQRALNEAGHGGRIKATVPLNADVYDSVNNQPSTGSFRSDISSIMVDLFRFLAANGSPCMVNIYPFLSLTQDENFPVNFAFFDDGNVGIQDKDKTYYNVFDANFDTLVWALKKVGNSDIEIIVGEIGWPTDGARHADIASAKRFYDGFLKKMASRKGTPMHPKPIKAYAFGLIDEDAKSILPGDFERHWGLLSYDGRPKFAVDLSGKGNSRLLAGAKGVEYMEKKWCLFNPDAATDPAAIAGNIQYACSRADCSAAAEGGSCYRLSSPESDASYAFNQYFQAMDQDVRACDFDGMAMTVEKNASTERCLFPIMVVSSGERSTAAAVAGAFLFAMVAALMFTAG